MFKIKPVGSRFIFVVKFFGIRLSSIFGFGFLSFAVILPGYFQGVAFAGSPVLGSQVPVSSGIEPIGQNDPRGLIYGDRAFKGASQSTYFRQGNQNITLQVDYLLKKIEFLQTEVHGPLRQQNLRQKYQLLGGFCGPTPASSVVVSGEDQKRLVKCINDYSLLMKFWEVKAFASIGKNNDSIAALECKSVSPGGICQLSADGASFEASAEFEKREANKRDQQPAYATAKQLADFAQASSGSAANALSRVVDTADADWENKMFDALAPKEEDFRNFKQVQIDSGVMDISEVQALKGSRGQQSVRPAGVDREQFDAAQKEWAKLKIRLQAKAPVQGSFPSLAELRRTFVEGVTQDLATGSLSVHHQLYNQARGENVDYAIEAGKMSQARKSSPANQGSGVTSRAWMGGSGQSDKNPALVQQVIQLPPGKKVYQGDEQVVIPPAAGGKAGAGEQSVYYDPASRPSF